jgi:large subunit ribosomal protein L6
MSRKGKLPVALPKGVEVSINKKEISVKGPKGSLTQELHAGVNVEHVDNAIVITLKDENESLNSFQGLYRSLIENMVTGVTKGFEKSLDMIGVGYRAEVKGHHLNLLVGLSHPTNLQIPEGLHVKVEKGQGNINRIVINGIDKRIVGQYAADIRSIRPPEPYKGKGIRYVDEYVRRKAGKKAAK